MELFDPVSCVKGVGAKTAQLFERLGVYSVSDMLSFFPRRFESYPPICGGLFETGSVCALKLTVTSKPLVKRGRIVIVSCNATDGFSGFRLMWFRTPYIASTIKMGREYIFYGVVKSADASFTVEHPRVFGEDEYKKLLDCMQPVYPLTKGLSNKTVTNTVKRIFEAGLTLPETLSKETLDKYGFPPNDAALKAMHFPKSQDEFERARRKFVYIEFYEFLKALYDERDKNTGEINTAPIKSSPIADAIADGGLPYTLTVSQTQAIKEIKADIASEHRMKRLLEGDVGSGKTIVAFLTMLSFAENGYKSAIMAPTEVLAAQHYEALKSFVKEHDLPYDVVLLTGSVKGAARKEALSLLTGDAPVLAVGTQALFQDGVEMTDLGLVVTDEQHRFGVNQRHLLASKGDKPHILQMSATPIPRSLAMILYGGLDISQMREKPVGRLSIKTAVIGLSDRMTAYKLIYSQIQKGHQAYIICPFIEESEAVSGHDVISYARELKSTFPTDVRISMLNGRMSPSEKDEIMTGFAQGRSDILVSTTVVEVGINVPNATVIMIENAERFGLSQLHQLRGRVGRSKEQSYCVLVNESDSENAAKRLNIMHESDDGFHIAEEDLRLRGPGDYFGVRQSGNPVFALGDIYADSDIFKAAAADARSATA